MQRRAPVRYERRGEVQRSLDDYPADSPHTLECLVNSLRLLDAPPNDLACTDMSA